MWSLLQLLKSAIVVWKQHRKYINKWVWLCVKFSVQQYMLLIMITLCVKVTWFYYFPLNTNKICPWCTSLLQKILEHSLTHFTPPLTRCRTLIDKRKAALALEENGREDWERRQEQLGDSKTRELDKVPFEWKIRACTYSIQAVSWQRPCSPGLSLAVLRTPREFSSMLLQNFFEVILWWVVSLGNTWFFKQCFPLSNRLTDGELSPEMDFAVPLTNWWPWPGYIICLRLVFLLVKWR